MRTIWKYELKSNSLPQTISMPRDAIILHVEAQHNVPCIWALVEADNILETRTFMVLLTGQLAPNNLDELNYLGTCQIGGGNFVGHVFEETEDE